VRMAALPADASAKPAAATTDPATQ
jgi:hypothetical protein